MLPYTPLHHLLARALGRALVLTSGNLSDEPIAFEDGDARERLSPVADAFLTHDRPIHVRADDSVARVIDGRQSILRRSRGYVPQPLTLPLACRRPVLACGAELKAIFGLAKDRRCFVSHHIGDLENFETYRSYVGGIEHFERLFGVRPELVAHDLHPEYLSTKYARQLADVELTAVQHHHAHVASCLADNGEAGPVIGVAFDGLGFGEDGTLWGGEYLVAGLASFRRVGFLRPVPLPGGAAAVKEPWRMAAVHLDATFGADIPSGLEVVGRRTDRWRQVLSLARSGLNSPPTSSTGRLFDAVAALVGVRDVVNYERQAAVKLEQLADTDEWSAYPLRLSGDRPFRLESTGMIRAVVEDLGRGAAPATVAARFHRGVAQAVVAGCGRVRAETGLDTVALSGGVFQNQLLVADVVARLRRGGFRVLTHARVPPNDGGISFGQAAVAAARNREKSGGPFDAEIARVRGAGAG